MRVAAADASKVGVRPFLDTVADGLFENLVALVYLVAENS